MKKKERNKEKRTASSPPPTEEADKYTNPIYPFFFPYRLTTVTLGYQILLFCGDLVRYAQISPIRNIRFF